jgi:hypothetical protein
MSFIGPTSSGAGGGFGGTIGGVFSGLSGAVSDIFAAQGDQAEAQQYEMAAQLAEQEAAFTKIATGVTEVQQQRRITQAIGGEKAGYGASGLALSGSALDVLRASSQQGSLALQTTAYQGAETEYSYNEQAKSYKAMASAAEKASQGGIFGAILSGAGALFNAVGVGSAAAPGIMAALAPIGL